MAVKLNPRTALLNSDSEEVSVPDNLSLYQHTQPVRATKMSDTFRTRGREGKIVVGNAGDYLVVDGGWLTARSRADFEANFRRVGGPTTPDPIEEDDDPSPAPAVAPPTSYSESTPEVEEERDHLAAQIDDLGLFILKLDLGYPKHGEGACYEAKALISELLEERAAAEVDGEAMERLVELLGEYEADVANPIASAVELLSPVPAPADEHPDFVAVYRDEAGEWRWRRHDAHNHEVVATSGEGYSNKSHAVEMATKLNVGTVVEEVALSPSTESEGDEAKDDELIG